MDRRKCTVADASFRQIACAATLALAALAPGLLAAEPKFRVQEISKQLTIGYATRILDMNDDGRPDILVVDTKRVIWFENPDWSMHTILEGGTLPDNVSIAPADIDGDGKVDFALAADWRPADTHASGSLQWLSRGKSPDEAVDGPPDRHRAHDSPHSIRRSRWRRPRRAGRGAVVRPLVDGAAVCRSAGAHPGLQDSAPIRWRARGCRG